MTYLTWEIFRNPEVKRKLQAELDAAIPDLSQFPSIPVLEKLPYLRVCLRETLRVHAAAPSTMPRYVPKEGLQVDEIHLPEGVTVGVQAYSVHRMRDVFGDDFEAWRPERWLEGDTKKMDKAYIPFSQGPL